MTPKSKKMLDATEQNIRAAQTARPETMMISHPTLVNDGVYLDYRNGWRICWPVHGKQPKRTLITEQFGAGRPKTVAEFDRAWRIGGEMYLARDKVAACTFGKAAASFIAEIKTGQSYTMKVARRSRGERHFTPELIATTVASIEALLPYWGGTMIRAIGQDGVVAFRAHLRAKFHADRAARIAASPTGMDPDARLKEPGTEGFYKRELLILRVCDHALRKGLINQAEMPELVLALRSGGVRGIISDAQWASITRHLARYAGGRHGDRTFVQFILCCEASGLRPGAVNIIRIGDIDWTDGSFLARPYKGHAAYTSYPDARFFDAAKVMLAMHPNRPDPEAPLFAKLTGEAYSMDSYKNRFTEVRKALGITTDKKGGKIDQMSLRHRYVVAKLDAQVSIEDIARNIGTSPAMIRSHYGDHIRPAATHHRLMKSGWPIAA